MNRREPIASAGNFKAERRRPSTQRVWIRRSVAMPAHEKTRRDFMLCRDPERELEIENRERAGV